MFAKYVEEMRNTCAVMGLYPQHRSALGRLVCGGLQLLSSRSAEFDAVVSSDFPFKKHFFGLLTSLQKGEDGILFAVFEDLALFARVRSLKLGAEAITQEEKEILEYFETSGEWGRDTTDQITTSYWHDLPKQIQQA